jgi:hypothetical protein
MMKTAGLAILAAFVLGAAALGTCYWIRTLQDVSRQETDPKERRKWWLRVFFLRFVGTIWYDNHRRKQAEGAGAPVRQ